MTPETAAAVFAWAYLAAFLVWLVLRVFWFDAHWTLALINDNTLYLFAPLLLLFPFAFAQRDYVLFCALTLPGAVFVLFYGARFVPKIKSDEPAPNNAFTVTSFNMHFENWDRDAFVKTILANKADLVGIQEVSENNRVFIETQLDNTYPFRVYQPISEVHAVALLSRYPLSDIEFLPPPMERGLRATAHLPSGTVNVIVAHLAPPNMLTYPLKQFVPLARERFASRRAQVTQLNQLAQANVPTVLLCDCNMSDASKTYLTLAEHWRDAFTERGWGFGHTLRIFTPVPVLRYDYIWHTAALTPHAFHIGGDGGSDHLPVTAVFSKA